MNMKSVVINKSNNNVTINSLIKETDYNNVLKDNYDYYIEENMRMCTIMKLRYIKFLITNYRNIMDLEILNEFRKER